VRDEVWENRLCCNLVTFTRVPENYQQELSGSAKLGVAAWKPKSGNLLAAAIKLRITNPFIYPLGIKVNIFYLRQKVVEAAS
jgi:hypothetical protein